MQPIFDEVKGNKKIGPASRQPDFFSLKNFLLDFV